MRVPALLPWLLALCALRARAAPSAAELDDAQRSFSRTRPHAHGYLQAAAALARGLHAAARDGEAETLCTTALAARTATQGRPVEADAGAEDALHHVATQICAARGDDACVAVHVDQMRAGVPPRFAAARARVALAAGDAVRARSLVRFVAPFDDAARVAAMNAALALGLFDEATMHAEQRLVHADAAHAAAVLRDVQAAFASAAVPVTAMVQLQHTAAATFPGVIAFDDADAALLDRASGPRRALQLRDDPAAGLQVLASTPGAPTRELLLVRAALLLQQEAWDEALALLPRVHGALDARATLAFAQAAMLTGDFPLATQLLNEIDDASVFERTTALRSALAACATPAGAWRPSCLR